MCVRLNGDRFGIMMKIYTCALQVTWWCQRDVRVLLFARVLGDRISTNNFGPIKTLPDRSRSPNLDIGLFKFVPMYIRVLCTQYGRNVKAFHPPPSPGERRMGEKANARKAQRNIQFIEVCCVFYSNRPRSFHGFKAFFPIGQGTEYKL